MNNPSTDNRVAKLVVMAQNATQEGKNEEALKCYNAILQIDPNNEEADLYVFILTPYLVKVYDHQISEYYYNLISKFQACLRSLKDKNLSNRELHNVVERLWSDIQENCFTHYNDYSKNPDLQKEIQGHSVRLESAEKVGDCIIAEFPKLKDIAVEVWGYEVGCIYQTIAKLKDKTKYDPEAIDIWENYKKTYDIYQVARKILQVDNMYLSPYKYCPQEIEEFFEQNQKAKEAKKRTNKIWICVLILILMVIFACLS